MSEQLLMILKFCLLALLYLFFLRVLRAVWTEVSPPPAAVEKAAGSGRGRGGKPTASAKPAKTKGSRARRSSSIPSHLVPLEPPGRVGSEFQLGDEVTIGRAAGCSIVLDEQYVSQVHARLFMRGDSLFAEDLGSTNGTWVNGSRAIGQMPVRPGDRVQIGNVIMEAR